MDTKRIIIAAMVAAMSVGAWGVPANPRVLQQLKDEGRTEELEAMLARERVSNGHTPTLTLRQQTDWTTVKTARQEGLKRSAAGDIPYETNIAPRGIVILAEFADLGFKPENDQATMDSMLNAETYTHNLSIGSARKYFYDQSNGLYHPHFDVVGPVKLPQNMNYYGQNNSRNEDKRCGQFVLDACSEAVKIEGVDFDLYDNNQDGVLDFVYIIYPGYNEAEGAASSTLWPASWDMEAAVYWGNTELQSGENGDWANKEKYTIGGKVIRSFAYSSELSGTRGNKRAGISTFCHEFSHVIGLPDLYDTCYGTNSTQRKTPGTWSLLDSGTYNEDGQVPPNYSAFDKWFVGWVEPTLLNYSDSIVLPADGQTYYYITEDGIANTPANEHYAYYIENRQREGWDIGIPGHGMLLWRVRYDDNIWYNNEVNASKSYEATPIYNKSGETLYTIVSATGSTKRIGSEGDAFPGYMNVTEWTVTEPFKLSGIQEQEGVIYADFIGWDKEEGIINVNDNDNGKIQKTIINGQLYIKQNEKTYTITGQRLD